MKFHKRVPPAGSRVGTLSIPADSPAPRIRVFDYDPDGFEEVEIEEVGALRAYLDSPRFTWVHVEGFGDEAQLRAIGDIFGFHVLTLEDATNVPQRAKVARHEEHDLVIARAPEAGSELSFPQVCLIVGKNFVLTFQDRSFGFFDAVRDRIRDGTGRPIRRLGPSYLLYALLDTLVDHYYPVVEALGERLDALEEQVNDNPDPRALSELHEIRRDLVLIRRIGWPLREALRNLCVEPTPFVSEEVRVFLRHTESHFTQIMEAVDSARDMTTGLADIYLSSVSQRTNEIMKVLTLMASIFIPLTFLAGIYGMNFENMPELRQPWGYPLVLLGMAAGAVGMLQYFRRKGWIGTSRRGDRQ